MANHKKTETSAKLKKFYANMSNAIKLAETEWGVDTLSLGYGCANTRGQKQWFEEHLAKYISYTKADYVDSSNDYYNDVAKGMYDEFQGYNSELFVVYLNDGSLYFNDECSDLIVYDVNGEKGPNQYGRDLFYFYILTVVDEYWQILKYPHFNTISHSRILQENGYEETYSREERKQNCVNKSSMAGCSALLEMDGWEFKDDYPWKL